MAESKQQSGDGIVRRMVKSALTQILTSVVAAGSAYVTRKATELTREKLIPKIQEHGGGRAAAKDTVQAAKETVETVAEKVAAPAEETVAALKEKVAGDTDDTREQAQRGREQRRRQRRRALEKSGSS